MVHLDQFPMFRLATLLARQISSPIASQLKVYARQHPRFGIAICARAGRWYRYGEMRFKLWANKLAGPRFPVSISDREAIDIGTDILGEAIVFSLGALIVVYEVNRQAQIKEAKELDVRSHWVAILTALEELKIELEIQQKEIDQLLAAIRELDPEVPLPLPSTLIKPSREPVPTTDPTIPPAKPDQRDSSSVHLPIPPALHPPLAGPPVPYLPPGYHKPGCRRDCKCICGSPLATPETSAAPKRPPACS